MTTPLTWVTSVKVIDDVANARILVAEPRRFSVCFWTRPTILDIHPQRIDASGLGAATLTMPFMVSGELFPGLAASEWWIAGAMVIGTVVIVTEGFLTVDASKKEKSSVKSVRVKIRRRNARGNLS